jgi:hypothetical protein
MRSASRFSRRVRRKLGDVEDRLGGDLELVRVDAVDDVGRGGVAVRKVLHLRRERGAEIEPEPAGGFGYAAGSVGSFPGRAGYSSRPQAGRRNGRDYAR